MPVKQRIALLTSGGDAPGMNAAIRAVVRTACYHDIEVVGVRHGFAGLLTNDYEILQPEHVGRILNLGGTILKTGRCKEFMQPQQRQLAADNLQRQQIDALIVIGGDGSLIGAELLQQLTDIQIIGIPATIDNDIVGTDYAIGFDTATNTAVDAIDKIRDTADAFNRLFLVEVMGKTAGNIALNSGVACGAESILIPEKITSIAAVLQNIDSHKRRQKSIHIIVVAEGDKFGIEQLAQQIQQHFTSFDVRTCCLGHIQRGGSPTQHDRVQASRLGYAAVMAVLQHQRSIMIGMHCNQIIYYPLSAVATKNHVLSEDWLQMLKILSS